MGSSLLNCVNDLYYKSFNFMEGMYSEFPEVNLIAHDIGWLSSKVDENRE
jgi:hypothetical protein